MRTIKFTTATTKIASCFSRPCFSTSPLLLRGEARRLTHDERAARRTPKSRDEKLKIEQTINEAEAFIHREFVDELQHEFDVVFGAAQHMTLRLMHPMVWMEMLLIDEKTLQVVKPPCQKVNELLDRQRRPGKKAYSLSDEHHCYNDKQRFAPLQQWAIVNPKLAIWEPLRAGHPLEVTFRKPPSFKRSSSLVSEIKAAGENVNDADHLHCYFQQRKKTLALNIKKMVEACDSEFKVRINDSSAVQEDEQQEEQQELSITVMTPLMSSERRDKAIHELQKLMTQLRVRLQAVEKSCRNKRQLREILLDGIPVTNTTTNLKAHPQQTTSVHIPDATSQRIRLQLEAKTKDFEAEMLLEFRQLEHQLVHLRDERYYTLYRWPAPHKLHQRELIASSHTDDPYV